MRDDIRERFFTPFLLPVTVIGVMLLFGISLSRVLLAVSEFGAVLVALLAAGYIMAMAFFVQSRRRIPGRMLGVALAVGLIGVVGAGAVASAAGMRSLEEESAGEQEGGGGEGGGGQGANEPLFVAIDIEFEQAPETLPTGDLTLVLENQGAIEHNIVIEELGDELIVETAAGETASGDVTLEAGDYTYYCSVTGHREAGMEGTLTADPSAESGGGGGTEQEPSGGASEEEPPAGGASEESEEAGSSEDESETGAASESER
jgi:plastocyanin